MKDLFRSFPLAVKMITKDPVNLLLAIVPTLIALFVYLMVIFYIYTNTEQFMSLFKGYVLTSDHAGLLAKILSAVLIIFVFMFMSWTFVFVAGILASPFNAVLSARIEKALVEHLQLEGRQLALEKVKMGLAETFKNELKKIMLIGVLGTLAFFLNFFPLLYPVGLFLFALLLAMQFLDYSWSRHQFHFWGCLKDILVNLIHYSLGGFFFLLLVTVPIINAFIPALATSYFTILWLHRQNKI